MASKFLLHPVYSQIRNNSRHITTASKGFRETDYVLAEEMGDKGVLILNRPKALNALNCEMIDKLSTTIEKWQTSKSMIIVKSNGNAFSAGGDVTSVVQADTPEFGKRLFRHGYAMHYMISKLPIPYITLNDGVTFGGGVGMSIFGKFRIATDKTVFAMPEATIGKLYYFCDLKRSFPFQHKFDIIICLM